MKKLVLFLYVAICCGFIFGGKGGRQNPVSLLSNPIYVTGMTRKEILDDIFARAIKTPEDIWERLLFKYRLCLKKSRFSTNTRFAYKGIETSIEREFAVFAFCLRLVNCPCCGSLMHSKEELEKSMFWGAFRHHALDVAQLLVQEGYWYEFDKYTTLQLAISPSKELEETDVEPLVTLVLDEKKRRLNKREFSAYINQQRKGDGATALILAVDSGYIGIAKKLLDLGADPNKSDSRGFTPLFIAFWNENVKLIQLLLDRGADVNSAVQFTNPEKVPEDVKCMLDVTQPISLLGLSLNNKRREFLEMFLPYINGENKDKIYPLLSGRAIYEGNTGLANLLIENGFDATSVMQLPNNTDYRTAKSVIMVFVANGMPITTIPIEKLDDDMIWAYVRRCLTEPGVLVVTPEKPFEKGVMARKMIEAFRRRSAIEPLPAPYCTMVLNFCDRACEPEIEIVENVVQTLKIVREMPEEKNSSFEVVSGAKPTQTQIRAIKMSNAARKKALQGPGQTSRKGKESEESVSKEPLSTVFKLTPGEDSRNIEDDAWIFPIIRDLRDCLKNFGIIINDRTDSGHHVFSVSCEGQPWISEFICRFGRIPTLAKIHGGSQVCTDHYDATISYLFHLVFLSVRHRPEARDGCKMLLGKYSNNLIADELKEHYEDVLELLGIEL